MAVVPFEGQNVQFELAKAGGAGACSLRLAARSLTQHMRDQFGTSSDTKLCIHAGQAVFNGAR